MEKSVAEGRVEKTQPNIFSADETAHECPLNGTKQISISTLNMSAFGSKADIPDRLADVC
jgi:hypothetical protein